MPGSYHLRAIGYKEYRPYVDFTSFCWNLDCPTPGSDVDFLNINLALMNSTAEIVQLDLDIDDTIEMISNGSADISVQAVRQTLERMQKVDFATPTGYLYNGYFIKEVPQLEVVDYILSSFDFDVVVLLALCGCSVGILLYWYTRIFRTSRRSVFDWIWITSQGLVHILGIINQFNLQISGPTSARILAAVWLWFSFAILIYYQAKLRSFFALSHKRGTIFTNFDGVLDAVQYEGWTMVIQERGYTPYLFCKPHQCERLNGLKNRILYIDRSKDMLEYVALDRHVGFGALPYDTDQYPIVVFDRKRSVLFVTDVDIAPEYLAFALNKLDNIRNRYAIPYEQYDENPREKEHIILKFAHIRVLFYAWLILTALSFLSFVVEKIFYLFRHELGSLLCGFRYTLRIRTSVIANPVDNQLEKLRHTIRNRVQNLWNNYGMTGSWTDIPQFHMTKMVNFVARNSLTNDS
ncbi:hypothetical protein Aduo_006965 [Ancylostoma duodenale]